MPRADSSVRVAGERAADFEAIGEQINSQLVNRAALRSSMYSCVLGVKLCLVFICERIEEET